MRKLTQPWPTKDGRHVLPHFGLPNLRARTLKLLGCDATPKSVADAVARWDALDLEAAIDDARVCGGMVRSNTEWLAEPHGQALAQKPIVEVIKIGDSDPEPMPTGPRPLSDVRVLDLTRILAGPIAARTLAEHGADVLMVTAEHLPQIPEHVLDTSHGKRSCFLNLNDADQAEQLRALVRDADVFSQGYRPGMLERLGFGPQALAEIRPGIIYSSVSCYGADGPFSHRAGWEQVAQTMTGIAFQGRNQDNPDRPALLPGSGLRLYDRLSGGLWNAHRTCAASNRRRELPRPRLIVSIRHVHLPPRTGGVSRFRCGALASRTRRFSRRKPSCQRSDSSPWAFLTTLGDARTLGSSGPDARRRPPSVE